MEKLWKVLRFSLGLLLCQLCNGLPINSENTVEDPHTQLLTGLVAVLLTICSVVFLAGCLCCQRKNGFKREPSTSQETFPGGREVMRFAFLKKGTPPSATNIIISSLSDETIKQYSACWKKYWNFCRNRDADPYQYNLKLYLEFLLEIYKTGSSYSVINSYRSALNFLLKPISKRDEDVINRFIKGIANIRPPTPKYSYTWSPDPLLKFLSKWYPLEDINMESLTHKLVTLMAITLISRVQTLSLIKLPNIKRNAEQIEIRISEKIKTSVVGKPQPTLILPYLRDRPELCVASTLEFYLKQTSEYRQNQESLFLTYKKPYHPATSQTISRWIKKTLDLGGIDTSLFTAHSVRHAASSAAFKRGINLDTLKETAGWTPSSNTFFKFYNKPINEPQITVTELLLSATSSITCTPSNIT